MKKLLLLLLLVPMVSCSIDDEPSETTSSIFLEKYNNTIWEERTEFYYKNVDDIKFSNSEYFISFFDINSQASYCSGWKKGENTFDGVKSEIEIIRDNEFSLWFRYDHYGFSEEIEYSITHQYNLDDGILFYSNSESLAGTYLPSERNYSESFLDTGVITKSPGCMFY
tara:strand:+ start:236 stop:739 length:504 start_codon:yes stop_codon:yes gene_type:complete